MLKTKTIVNVSDAKVSSDPANVIVTYSLGSCIAVSLYDQTARVGGMLHYQLPSSGMEPERASEKPFMFADTGMELLIDKLVSMGGVKKRMHVKIAGGAAMDTGPKGFDIGKRNHLAIRKVLWKHGMFIDAEDVGGSWPRNMSLDLESGAVIVKANGVEKLL
ncbi:MAG: chemotaxis protein CheD [Phycisphaerae bacterium]|nr:chemotaxis protein CheD [Phycisphaerae bacterium]